MLVAEANGKCANPGCSNTLVEFHHINRWHVVRTHDPAHMVAVCGACHDSMERGSLVISDETAKAWKKLIRDDDPYRTHIYVEPGRERPSMRIGTMTFRTPQERMIFASGGGQHVAFTIVGDEIMHINVIVRSALGRELVTVTDGHVAVPQSSAVHVEHRPGRFRAAHIVDEAIVPGWMVDQMRVNEPDFAPNDVVTLLDLEVIAPNLVRVEGMWPSKYGAMVATRRSLSFVRQDYRNPLAMLGHPDGTDIQLDMPPGEPWWNLDLPPDP
jgi:hypothetical protein